ncbi:hypothetical protein MUP77_11550 [Candidatus Bathyarchaeota archaeon]|nr:hypothetical protein [Candidatus Bathyarchaeota archaeon]
MSTKKGVNDKIETPSSVSASEGSLKSEETRVVDQQGKVAQPRVRKERVKIGEQPEHHCGECKWYDKSTEREFHRNGIRQGLVETRAICKAPAEVSKASNHLVKCESNRPCFDAGVYSASLKEWKTNGQQSVEKKTETKPKETQHTETTSTTQTAETKQTSSAHKSSRKHQRMRAASATNVLSGETKILETNGRDKKVFVKDILSVR